jgi:hypothetical protein
VDARLRGHDDNVDVSTYIAKSVHHHGGIAQGFC